MGNVLWRNDGPGCGGWCWSDLSAARLGPAWPVPMMIASYECAISSPDYIVPQGVSAAVPRPSGAWTGIYPGGKPGTRELLDACWTPLDPAQALTVERAERSVYRWTSSRSFSA